MLYMTRIQQERFTDRAVYARLKGCYVLTADKLAAARADMPVLHPLPRVDEIALEVDSDPRAAYFEQAQNGVYARMALMMTLLGLAPVQLGAVSYTLLDVYKRQIIPRPVPQNRMPRSYSFAATCSATWMATWA